MSESPQTPEKPEQALEPAPVKVAVEPATEVTPPGPPPVAPPPPVPPAPEPPVAPAPPLPSMARTDGFATALSASDRPEIAVGAAFAGGFVLAMILKRLAR